MGLFLIAAIARDGALGVTRDEKPGLPWAKLIHDQAWFRSLTQSGKPLALARQWCHEERSSPYGRVGPQNAVIMGRRTWESLPGPMGNRQHYVLTSEMPTGEALAHAVFPRTLDDALMCASFTDAPHTFIIGGTRLFAEALLRPELAALFLTEIDAEYPEADTWWPKGLLDFEEGYLASWAHENGKAKTPKFRRELASPWIEDTDAPDAPRYRFGIWRAA